MGFFKWLKSKTVKEEIIFEGENLYEKIKSESIEDVGKMYEPLDKEIIEQAIVEDRVSNTFEQKKTSVEHICEQMVMSLHIFSREKAVVQSSFLSFSLCAFI